MKAKKLLVVGFLILLIAINFYLYSSEFGVLVDPNDNIFQYALVDEAKNIWKQVFAGKLSPFYLLDSWQERWAEGFALSSYYSHLPQAIIGLFGGYKLFVIIRTLMLITMPLMFFLGALILSKSWLYGLTVAWFSQLIFTDGLYGIDVSSFIWRGWGLSAQLMAVFFLPVAFAYTIDYFENPTSHKASLGRAVLFNFLVASSHFGIFSLALLGYPFYFLIKMWEVGSEKLDSDVGSGKQYQNSNSQNLKLFRILNLKNLNLSFDLAQDGELVEPFRVWDLGFRILLLIGFTLFSLSYFIIPFFLQGQYRNFSVWDPIWKFDSWGMRQIVVWFLNGDLFDFGRFSFITLSVIFGVFLGLGYLLNSYTKNRRLFTYLSLLFLMYFVLFFGRTTLGGLIDLIPGFSEYHQHRIIVMVQFVGIYLGAWFVYQLAKTTYRFLENFQFTILNFQTIFKIKNLKFNENSKLKIVNLAYILLIPLLLYVIYLLEQPLVNYARENSIWIERSNKAYLKDLPAYEKIKAKLASLPKARVYVGRPGNWGKQFTVGETPLYMVLSQDGYPVIGFLPESWSPNSDPEEFFDENSIGFYNLYNAGYSILPDSIKPPPFAKLITKEGKYNLYQIKTTGWFDLGQSSIAVKSKKTDLLNATRLWFGSKFFKQGDFPKIDLSKDLPDGKSWYIQMSDKNNFINLNDGKERNIWRANPFDANVTTSVRSQQIGNVSIADQEVLVNGYKATVEVKEECPNCILVLKQSFHPNWEVKINGKSAEKFPVFPFYIAIPIEKPGNYEVRAEYKPGSLKVILILVELGVLAMFLMKKSKSFLLS